uniref:ShKT domain-containing protein n=1 Tax=Magallana gigas TaxID=29159 RepID=A0A8W8M8N5_MAGGI
MYLSAFFSICFLFAGTFVYCNGEECVDKLPECATYTRSSCDPPNVVRAHQYCPAICGYCHKQCEDRISDCHRHGISVCLSHDDTWAKENCAAFCGFCGPDVKCRYSDWEDLGPCPCKNGLKTQVRTFIFVKNGTYQAEDCGKDLVKITFCTTDSCSTSSVLVTQKVPVPAVVTEKTSVHEPVVQTHYETHYEHPHVDPDVIAGVAAAGTAVAGGFALGSLLTGMLPLLAFGKRAPNDDKKAVEDLLESVLNAQGH